MWWGDYGVHKLPPIHMATSELSSGIYCLRSRQSLCERLVAWLGISSLEAMLKGNATKMQPVCPNIGAFIETFKEEGQT